MNNIPQAMERSDWPDALPFKSNSSTVVKVVSVRLLRPVNGVFEMRFNASSESCSPLVQLELSEPRDGAWAPLTGAAVSGVGLALIAAALIYACHRKRRRISTAPCGCVRRRLEEEEEEEEEDEEEESDSQSHRADERVCITQPQWTVNSDVAAFALKARVVYPINQRYRPLADGASNPSLHEPPKHQAPPTQDSASSLGDDWPSQERDDDDESSQFVSCGPSSKTHGSHVFRRVQDYPQTPSHSRMSLLCLTLEELQRHTSRLQQEKQKMFLQILRVLLDETEHADIIQEAELRTRGVSVDEGAESDAATCSVQEAELRTRGVSVDEGAETDMVTCSVQEAELQKRGVSVDKGAESGAGTCSVQEAELWTRGVSLDEGAESDAVKCSVQKAELRMRGVSVDKGADSGAVTCSVQEAELQTRGVSVDKGAESGTVTCSVEEPGLWTRGVSVDEGAESGAVTCSVEEVEKAGREQLECSLQTAVSFAKQLHQLGQKLQRRLSSDVSEEVMRSIMGCLRPMEDILAEVQASVLQMLLDRIESWQEVSDCLREKTALLKQEAELMVKLTGQSVEQLRADGQLETQTLSELQTAVNALLEQSADVIRAEPLEHDLKGCLRRRRRMMMKAQRCEWSRLSDTHTDSSLMMKTFAELQMRHWVQRRECELQQDSRLTAALCERWTSLFGQSRERLAGLCSAFVLSTVTAGSAPSEELCQSVLKSIKLTVTNQMQREERRAHTHLRRLREQLQRRRQVWMEDMALTRSCLDHFGQQQRAVVMAMVSGHSGMQMRCELIEEQQHLLILEFQRILAARWFYLRSVKEMKLTIEPDTQDSCVAVETAPSEEAVIGQNLLHEQLSELEAAADMLQGHAHFLLGHALARVARLQTGGVPTDRQLKERLIDAVCESVYGTRDSVQALIREYYCELRKKRLTPHSNGAEDTDTQTERTDCTRALQTQLNNWARKPTSTELHHRVVELKRKCLKEFQKDHHRSVQTHNNRLLREEEEAFMCRLASLARVSLSSMSEEDFTGFCSQGACADL
ncbi:evC complex member EVC isoform X2 [Pseudorasbora parva]|uniref:evC complex member EVC isoform X2 n=1 Tax=Pseudorasbora parva TaxID=51549 RepID=UPI00351ED8B9